MKKLIITITLALTLICTSANAAISNPNTLYSTVLKNYEVGYVIENNVVLGSDMSMYSLNTDKLIKGWYIAYDLETNLYYYITQDTAIDFIVELNK